MNTKDIIQNIYHYLGLKLINTLASSGSYYCQTDISYGDKPRNYLDYYTGNGDINRPTVLFFYGGNWRSGERQDYRFVADTLSGYGYNVVIPDLRHYPNVRFSEIQEDAINACRWVLEKVPAEQPIYIMGHSSGAQLGALLCLNRSLLPLRYAVDKRIKGFVGLAGPYDFYPFTDDDHWDLFSPSESYPESQAVNYIRANAPPMYLLHGEIDARVRRGHSKSLMEKLHAVGGRAKREVYPDIGHVDIILGFTRLHRARRRLLPDILNFLKTTQV